MDGLKLQVAAQLAQRKPKRGEQSRLAQTLRVTTRTLRNWRALAMQGASPARGPGRPRASGDPTWRELRWIVRAWHWLAPGHDGWRTLECLADLLLRCVGNTRVLRTAWLQGLVKRLKYKRKRRGGRRAQRARQSALVLASNALWAADETFVGRDEQGEVRVHVLRETLAPKTLALAVGAPATADDLIALLEQAARERGALPLVLSLDNSGPARSEKLRAWLREHQVILLLNAPRTPEHNAFAERGVGELACVVEGARSAGELDAGDRQLELDGACATLVGAGCCGCSACDVGAQACACSDARGRGACSVSASDAGGESCDQAESDVCRSPAAASAAADTALAEPTPDATCCALASALPTSIAAPCAPAGALCVGTAGPSALDAAWPPTPRSSRIARLMYEWANAACTLNAHTPRPDLGGLTPDELDRIAPHAEDHVSRARFYHDACAALARAAAEHPHGRARRMAERDAIYSTLEQHRLLTRTRGGQPLSRPSNRKGIS